MAAAALRNVNRQRESPEPCALHRTRVSGDMRRVRGAGAYRRCVCYPLAWSRVVSCWKFSVDAGAATAAAVR